MRVALLLIFILSCATPRNNTKLEIEPFPKPTCANLTKKIIPYQLELRLLKCFDHQMKNDCGDISRRLHMECTAIVGAHCKAKLTAHAQGVLKQMYELECKGVNRHGHGRL